MANRTFNPPRALEKELIALPFRFSLSAAAAVVAGSTFGRGVTSVTKTGTGQYTVQLQDIFPAFLSADFTVRGTGTVVTVPELRSQSVPTNGQLVIKTVTRSTGAEADTAVAYEILCTIYVRNSTVA